MFLYVRDTKPNVDIYLLAIYFDKRQDIVEFLFRVKQYITIRDFVYLYKNVVFVISFCTPNDDLYNLAKAQGVRRVGMSVCPRDAFTLTQLEKEALNDIKNSDKNKLLYSFERSMKDGSVFLHYQPIVDTNKKIVAVEGLVRWYNNGVIKYPNDFIYDIESSPLVNSFSLYVIKKAMVDHTIWGKDVDLHVNFSVKQLHDNKFIDNLLYFIDIYSFDTKNIVIELTESFSLYDYDNIKDTIRKLKNKSIKLAIDDFGVKYSSLTYLYDFDIDILKTDRNLLKYDSWEKIILFLKELSESRGIKLVVEGVETEEQFKKLKDMGIDYIQGYYISKPITSLELNFMFLKGSV